MSTLPGLDSFFQPRRAAFWLMAMFLVNGAYYVARMLMTGFAVVPVTVVFGVLVWALYTLALFAVFNVFELLDQLPPAPQWLAFAWGGLGAVYLAIPANAAVFSLCAKLVSPEFAVAWGAALAGPTNEEFLKLMGVILVVLIARNHFRTMLPVLLLGAMVGLGFQVVENFTYSVNSSVEFPLETQFLPVLLNLGMRGVLSGLWSHAAYTTVASMGVAWFIVHADKPLWARIGIAILCYLLAWSLHFAWNSPLLGDAFAHLPGGIFLLMLVKGLPILLAAGLFWRVAEREEGQHLRALAEQHVPERELIREDERARLGSPLARLAARRQVRKMFGKSAGQLKRRLQREQVRLVRLASVHGRGQRTQSIEQAIMDLRSTLARLESQHTSTRSG